MRIFSPKAFTTFSKPNFNFSKCITEADSEIDYQSDFLNQSCVRFSAPPLKSFLEEIDYEKFKEKKNQLKERIKELELKVEELTRIVGRGKEENLFMNLNLKKLHENIFELEKKLAEANLENQTLKQGNDKTIHRMSRKNVLFDEIESIKKEYEDKMYSLKTIIQMNEKILDDSRTRIIEYKSDKEKSKKTILDLTIQSSNKSKIIEGLKKEIQTKEEILTETTKKLFVLKNQIKFNKDKEPGINDEINILNKQMINRGETIDISQLNIQDHNRTLSEDQESSEKLIMLEKESIVNISEFKQDDS